MAEVLLGAKQSLLHIGRPRLLNIGKIVAFLFQFFVLFYKFGKLVGIHDLDTRR